VSEKVPEVLTRGHVIDEIRVGKIEERANLSQYPVMPTRFDFMKVVRITSMVIMFIVKARKNKRILSQLLQEGKLWFTVFHAEMLNQEQDQDSELLNLGSLGMVVSQEVEGRDQGEELKFLKNFVVELYLERGNEYLALYITERGAR
jgi:hypothetical protein